MAKNGSFDITYWEITESMDNAVTNNLITLSIPDYANTTTWKIGESFSIVNDGTTSTNYKQTKIQRREQM